MCDVLTEAVRYLAVSSEIRRAGVVGREKGTEQRSRAEDGVRRSRVGACPLQAHLPRLLEAKLASWLAEGRKEAKEDHTHGRCLQQLPVAALAQPAWDKPRAF